VALVNRGGAVASWNPQTPTATLVPAHGRARSRPIAEALHQSGNVSPPPGEAAYVAQFDLRRLFGKLPAGRYQLRVGPAHADFAIADTTLADAERASGRPAGLDLIVDPPRQVEKNLWRLETATLVNRSGAPVTYAAYIDNNPSHPLMTTMTWERWHPAHGWQSPGPMGWCGTGLGQQTTAAGARQRLHLLGGFSDGIYRYVLTVDQGGRKLRIPSQAVLVDNFAYYGTL
jgi:hypothetical protein